MEIRLGHPVRDVITGFKGIVVGIIDYISGCRQALVTPPVNEKGDIIESRYFDTDRLEVTGAALSLEVINAGSPADVPLPPAVRG
jgi:hypothetical protein